MTAAGGTLVAGAPLIVAGGEYVGTVVVGTGRTIVQGGRALITEVSKYGVIGAAASNPVTTTTLVTEGAVLGSAVATGADTPLSAPANTARRATAEVVETVADAVQDARRLAAKQTVTTASWNGSNAGQGALKNIELPPMTAEEKALYARNSWRKNVRGEAMEKAPTDSSGNPICEGCAADIEGTMIQKTKNGDKEVPKADLDHNPSLEQRVQEWREDVHINGNTPKGREEILDDLRLKGSEPFK